MNKTNTAVLHDQHSLTRAKAHASTSYTAMESATEVTLNLRFGIASQSFPILVIWTGSLSTTCHAKCVRLSGRRIGFDYLKSIKKHKGKDG